MQTPWGEFPVADAHTHFFSRRFFDSLAAQMSSDSGVIADRLGWVLPPEDPAELARVWAAELDRHAVSRSMLIASVPGDEASVLAAAAACPGRFLPAAMLNPLAENAAVTPGLRVICLFPAMHRYSLHDPRVAPLLEQAAALGCSVFVHCGVLTVGVRKKLGLPSLFDMRFSNPLELHAIALRYRRLTFLIPHFGAGYFREALMLADLCPNVCLDTSSSNRWMRYQESHMDLRQVFRHALDVVGPKRLLFGSDSSYYPRGWHHQIFEEQATALYELGVSLADARAVFGENLLRIMAA